MKFVNIMQRMAVKALAELDSKPISVIYNAYIASEYTKNTTNQYNHNVLIENIYFVLLIVVRIGCCLNVQIESQIFLANLSYLNSQSNIFNYQTIKFLLISILFNWRLYYHPDKDVIEFLYQLSTNRSFMNRFMSERYYEQIIKQINKLSKLINFIINVPLFLGIVSAFVPIVIKYEWFVNSSIITLLGYFVNTSILLFGSHLLIKNIHFSICFLFITTNLLKYSFLLLNRRLLVKKCKVSKQTYWLNVYWYYYLQILRIFVRFNTNMVGNTFIYTIVLFSVTHSYAIVWIVKSIENHINSKLFLLALTCECLIITIVYVYLCSFTKYIHSSSKRLISILFLDNCDVFVFYKKPCKSRIFLCFVVIEIVHNKKRRFGFTYSSLGLMTLMTFVKYVFFYGNIIMKTFNLQRLVIAD